MDLERHAGHIDALRTAILETAGATTPAQRLSAALGEPVGVADAYLRMVRTASYRIMDDDLDHLRRGDGLSEDAIFELTLAAAFGEAKHSFDAAIAAMRRSASSDDAT